MPAADSLFHPDSTVSTQQYFEKAADMGCLRSQYNVGMSCYSGDGVPKDYVKALKYLEMAACNDFAMQEVDIPQEVLDQAQAERNLTPTSVSGMSGRAALYVAQMCDPDVQAFTGFHSVPPDSVKALYFYEQAAERSDHPGSCLGNMGRFYLKGIGVPIDYEKARQYLEKAIVYEDPDSLLNISIVYANGLGVPKDLKKVYPSSPVAQASCMIN